MPFLRGVARRRRVSSKPGAKPPTGCETSDPEVLPRGARVPAGGPPRPRAFRRCRVARNRQLGRELSGRRGSLIPAARRLIMGGCRTPAGPPSVRLLGWLSREPDAAPRAHRGEPRSPTVATEFIRTSVSSPGPSYAQFMRWMPDNPHVRYFESRHRGLRLGRGHARADDHALPHGVGWGGPAGDGVDPAEFRRRVRPAGGRARVARAGIRPAPPSPADSPRATLRARRCGVIGAT